MTNISRLAIPCYWDEKNLKNILDIKSDKGVFIKEIYGAIPGKNIFDCRNKDVVKFVEREKALKIKQVIDAYNLEFAYVINAPQISINESDVVLELSWIINEFKASSITVTSEKLMAIIRKNFGSFPINVSTVAGILSKDDIMKYIKYKPQRIILHHDCNRNFKDLESIIKFCESNKIDIEIMVNESCLRRCPMRNSHYEVFSTEDDDHKFHVFCNGRKTSKPYEFLLANFIRPEDLKVYEDMGIYDFKVTGRSKSKEWIYETVNAYMTREYDGNLVRLLGIDPLLDAENHIYIENKALDGFLENFPITNNKEEEIEYCEKKIKNMYNRKEFYMDYGECLEEYEKLRFEIKKDIYSKSEVYKRRFE